MSIKSLLLEINPPAASEIILRLLVFIILSGFVIWIFNLFIQMAKNKSQQKVELIIRTRFLISLILYMVVFTIYFGILIWYNGIEVFSFNTATFYLGISHLIIALITLIILFFMKYKALHKLINL